MNSPASDRLKELYASWAKAQERKTGAMLAYQLRPCDTSPEEEERMWFAYVRAAGECWRIHQQIEAQPRTFR